MANKERNALAELAKRLDTRKSKDFIVRVDGHDVSLARRIIAELAKVRTLGPKHIPGDISLYKAYTECYAIAAEEGAKE